MRLDDSVQLTALDREMVVLLPAAFLSLCI